MVGVDIPAGLLERAVKGGRQCDREARRILRQPRARSVFSPPVRDALRCMDHASANKCNRESSPDRVGISIQSFGLRQKLLEMDGLITPKLQEIVKEVHPELSFYELNDRHSMKHGKKDRTGAGLAARRSALQRRLRWNRVEISRVPENEGGRRRHSGRLRCLLDGGADTERQRYPDPEATASG